MPTCKACKHAKRWFVGGGISVECLARGERGYGWANERECELFEQKPLKEPSISNVRAVKHEARQELKRTGGNISC